MCILNTLTFVSTIYLIIQQFFLMNELLEILPDIRNQPKGLFFYKWVPWYFREITVSRTLHVVQWAVNRDLNTTANYQYISSFYAQKRNYNSLLFSFISDCIIESYKNQFEIINTENDWWDLSLFDAYLSFLYSVPRFTCPFYTCGSL